MNESTDGDERDEPRRPAAGELDEIQRRVLWLATRMIDYANRERPNPDASRSAATRPRRPRSSSLMTALYFHWLRGRRPRLGEAPRLARACTPSTTCSAGSTASTYDRCATSADSSRTRRDEGSRPDRLLDRLGRPRRRGAAVRRRRRPLRARRTSASRDRRRFVALIGDAELDEGNVWEAIADPSHARPRQRHLDRRLQPPVARPRRPGHPLGASSRRCSADHGWHVEILKYGPRLRAAYELPGGDTLRRRIDDMPNARVPEPAAPAGRASCARRLLAGAPRRRTAPRWRACSTHTPTRTLAALIGNLAGHDLGDVLAAPRALRRRGRAAERHLRVHRQGLRPADRRPPAEPLGRAQPAADRRRCAWRWPTPRDEWAAFDPESAEAALCRAVAASG